MHALEALTAHFAYPLDVYMGAACLAVLSVCCAGVLFFVLGSLLLQEPGVREPAGPASMHTRHRAGRLRRVGVARGGEAPC